MPCRGCEGNRCTMCVNPTSPTVNWGWIASGLLFAFSIFLFYKALT